MKKKTYLLLFLVIFLASCMPPYTEINLDMRLEMASENMNILPHNAIQPEPGRHFFNQGSLITINAQELENHEFIKWTITPNYVQENTYNIFSKEYTFSIVRNKEIVAYYGCKTDNACNEGYTCTEENMCVEA